jgi:uncharacterized protein YlxP (DUF503 family)
MVPLFVGVGKVELLIRHARSLKDKRQCLKSIEQRLRNLGFSVVECGPAEQIKRGSIGFSYAGRTHANVDDQLEQAFRLFVGDAEVVRTERDIFDYSELESEPLLENELVP